MDRGFVPRIQKQDAGRDDLVLVERLMTRARRDQLRDQIVPGTGPPRRDQCPQIRRERRRRGIGLQFHGPVAPRLIHRYHVMRPGQQIGAGGLRHSEQPRDDQDRQAFREPAEQVEFRSPQFVDEGP